MNILILLFLAALPGVVPDSSKAVLAGGCFWCMEEAYERYVPGVLEVLSGYAGGDIENPTYRSPPGHAGHYEVVEISYDPSLTSYATLLEYYWRNVDPLDGTGQFCDKGHAYKAAIFYSPDDATHQNEYAIAQASFDQIKAAHPDWNIEVKLELLDRFWEDTGGYHQNYYLKNPSRYNYYKTACGRVQRLKDVWGKEEYDKYHDPNPPAAENVTNAYGDTVQKQVNVKNAPDNNPGLPDFILYPVIAGVVVLLLIGACTIKYMYSKKEKVEVAAEIQLK